MNRFLTIRFWICFCFLTGFLTGGPSRLFGQENIPSYRVSPSQVLLGALSYGQTSSPPIPIHVVVSGLKPGVQVTNIDCSHAQGIRVVAQRREGESLVVDFETDIPALTAGSPYGAFIKRDIRLETNSPNQPQYVVPVTGWLGVNGTSRDFSRFVFKGETRWQGIWSTPNVAGAILTGLVLFAIGIMGWLETLYQRYRSVVPVFVLIGTIGVTCLILLWLAQTYSREAWVALFVAGAIAALCCPPLRRSTLGTLAIFALILLFMPHGFQRFQSSVDLSGDLSISNRFKLWEGALQIMAEHPLTGVGSKQFESIFERDYQDFTHTAKTTTAVNDFLTLGAEHGLFVLSLIMGTLLFVVVTALRLVRKTHHPLLMTLTAVLIGAMITSNFSSLFVVFDYQLLVAITFFGLISHLAVTAFRQPRDLAFARMIGFRASGWMALTFIALFTLANSSLSFLPTKTTTYRINGSGNAELTCRGVSPRWKSSQGTIIYLASSVDQSLLYHSTIRPLAAMGWTVIPLSDTADLTNARDLIEGLHRLSPHTDLFVVGEAKGGNVAWNLASTEPASVIRAGSGFNFLTRDLANKVDAAAPRQPFLVYQSLYTGGESSNPAICARDHLTFSSCPITVVLSPDEFTHFSNGWMRYLATLNVFFKNENPRG